MPSLEAMYIGTRKVKPILVRSYEQWQKGISEILTTQNSTILESLKQKTKSNCSIVLIFDQFEELFLVHQKQAIDSFFLFIKKCLSIPFVQIVFSLRDDYLHQILKYSINSHDYLINRVIASNE